MTDQTPVDVSFTLPKAASPYPAIQAASDALKPVESAIRDAAANYLADAAINVMEPSRAAYAALVTTIGKAENKLQTVARDAHLSALGALGSAEASTDLAARSLVDASGSTGEVGLRQQPLPGVGTTANVQPTTTQQVPSVQLPPPSKPVKPSQPSQVVIPPKPAATPTPVAQAPSQGAGPIVPFGAGGELLGTGDYVVLCDHTTGSMTIWQLSSSHPPPIGYVLATQGTFATIPEAAAWILSHPQDCPKPHTPTRPKPAGPPVLVGPPPITPPPPPPPPPTPPDPCVSASLNIGEYSQDGFNFEVPPGAIQTSGPADAHNLIYHMWGNPNTGDVYWNMEGDVVATAHPGLVDMGYWKCCPVPCEPGKPSTMLLVPGWPCTSCPIGGAPGSASASANCENMWACYQTPSGKTYSIPATQDPAGPGDTLQGMFTSKQAAQACGAAVAAAASCTMFRPCAPSSLELADLMGWRANIDKDWKDGSESYAGKVYAALSEFDGVDEMNEAIAADLSKLSADTLPSFVTFLDTLA